MEAEKGYYGSTVALNTEDNGGSDNASGEGRAAPLRTFREVLEEITDSLVEPLSPNASDEAVREWIEAIVALEPPQRDFNGNNDD